MLSSKDGESMRPERVVDARQNRELWYFTFAGVPSIQDSYLGQTADATSCSNPRQDSGSSRCLVCT
jgi:hypothetical protein